MPRFSIRPETAADVDAIDRITRAAFQHHPHSDQTEHLIIARLRAAGVLTLSLVAEQDGQVIGHAAFSPVTFSDGSAGWYGLGPIAVAPRHQGQGVGSALVQQGLELLRARGAAGCVVLGEPAYYGRFGFAHRAECVFSGAPAPYFQVLAFGNTNPSGEVAYHAAFAPD
jgi:putative acetyltransferase